jgi:hypothetical protein
VIAVIVVVPLLFVGFFGGLGLFSTWLLRQRAILLLIVGALTVSGTITIVGLLYRARMWWTWENAKPVLAWAVGLALFILCARLFMPWNPDYGVMFLAILFIVDVFGVLGIWAFFSGQWKL